jgi:hypothetical protein
MPAKKSAQNTQEEVFQVYSNEIRRKRPVLVNRAALNAVPVNSAAHNRCSVGDAVFVFCAAKSVWVRGSIAKCRKPQERAPNAPPKTTVQHDRPVMIIAVDPQDRALAGGCRAVPATMTEQIRVPIAPATSTTDAEQ